MLRNKIGLVAFTFALVVSAGVIIHGVTPLTAPPSGTWAPTAGPMAAARAGAASVLLPDGRVLITGGCSAGVPGAGCAPLASAEILNADGNFYPAPSMNYARSGHSATLLPDGRVLVAGGADASGSLQTAEVYDPSANTWTAAGLLMAPRSGHTATLLQDGTVLLAGGSANGAALKSLELFDPTQNTFSTVSANLSSARESHAAALLSDGRVLILGGSDGTTSAPVPPATTGSPNVLASTDIYDPAAGTIAPGPAMSTARMNLTATVQLDGKVAAIGGSNGQSDLASIEVFDPAAGSFASGGSLTTARSNHLAFLLPHNANILVVGGTSSGAAISGAELYCPWTGTSAATGSMSSARSAAVGSPLYQTVQGSGVGIDGALMVAGGSDASTPPNALSGAEVYGFATVKTDAADYPPGTTVNISGSGWQPNESVTITLVESPFIDTHGPYTVTADPNGNISDSSFTTDVHDFDVTFSLTATGSNSHAQTMFMDAGSDGTGAMTVSPTSVGAGSTPDSFTFTFTADPGKSFGPGGLLTMAAPAGWTAPTIAAGAGHVAAANASGTSCNPSIGTITGTGPWTIPISITCNAKDSFTLTYSAVTAPTATGPSTFTTQTRGVTGGTLTNIGSSPVVTVNAGPASKLAFGVQPSNTAAGSTISPAVSVQIEDQFGNLVSSTQSVALAIGTNPSAGTLTGGGAVAAVAGTAVFSGLSINNVGNGYTLHATSGSLTAADSGIFNITKVTVTPSVTASNKVYDGTTTATTSCTLAGVLPGDAGNVTCAASSSTFADKNVANGKTVTATGITLSGSAAGNYTLSSTTATTTANITARALTVTAATNTKTYDGTPSAGAIPTVTSGTVQPGDTANFTETYNNKNVGTGKTLTPAGSVTDGNGGNNYTYTFATNTTGVINALAISVTAATNTKTYDGTPSAAATPTITSGALQGTDTANFTEAYSSKNVGTGLTLTPGGTVNDGNSGNNYAYTFITNTTGVITARAITVTAAANSKTYDATTAAAAIPTITSGSLASGDSATWTETYDTKNVGAGKTLTPAGSVSDGNSGNNYAVTFANNTTGVINARAITVTAATNTKTYDGTTSAAATPTITSGALQGTDTATWTETYSNKNAGNAKTLTPAGTVSDGNGGANYIVTFANTTTGVINKLAITVTAATNTKTYDGTTSATAAPTITSGTVQTGDTANFTEVYSSKNAGTGLTLTPSGTVTDGNSGNNYSYTFVTNTTGVISARAITVTAATNSKVYDATTSAAAAPTITSGTLASGDTAGFTEVYASKNVGTGLTLTPSGSVNDGNSGNNYAVTLVTNTTGVITARAITVTAATNTKTYDGTTSAAATPTITSGTLQGTDTPSFTESYSTKTAGVGNKTLIPSGTVTDGNSGTNYSYTFVNFTTGTINTKALTVTGVTASDKAYDGTTTATLNTGSAVLVGVVPLDVVTLNAGSATGTFASATVGTGINVTISGLTVGGADGGNYSLTQPTTTANINAKILTVSGEVGANKVYDGGITAAVAFTSAVLNGVIGSDHVNLAAGNYTATFSDANVGNGKAVTIAGLKLTGMDSANYALGTPQATTTANITPATLTYTATPASRAYGASNPAFTGTVTGFVGTDNQGNATTGILTFTSPATTSSPAGSYAINGSGLTANNNNYTFVQAAGNATALTVTKVDQTITFGALGTKNLGDPDFSVSATASSSLTVSFSSQTTGVCSVSGSTVHLIAAGLCTIRASQPGDSNYNAAPNVDQSFTVNNPTTATTVTTSGSPSTYGQSVTFTATVTSAAGTPTGSVSFYDGACGGTSLAGPTALDGTGHASFATTALTVPTHTITACYTPTGIYLASSGSVGQTVSQAGQTITVTMHAPANAYFASSFGVAATSDSGLAVAITSSGVCSGSGTSSATITITSGSGPCVVHYNQSGNTNYSAATEVTDPVTALPAPVAVSVPDTTVTYDGTPQTVTPTLTPSASNSVTYTGNSPTVYATSTLAPTDPGSYMVVATVTDPNYSGSGSGTLTINKKDPGLNLVLESGSPEPSPYGTRVYFDLTTTGSPHCPTGTVNFYVDYVDSSSQPASTVTLDGSNCAQAVVFSTATLTPTSPNPPHQITAVYSGDADFLGVTSNAVPHNVTPDGTAVTLATSGTSAYVGAPINFTATLSPQNALDGSAQAPAGTVQFNEVTVDSQNKVTGFISTLGTGPVSGSGPYTAAFSDSALPAGPHYVQAVYINAGGLFAGSSSAVAVETVNKITPTITWPNPAPIVYGTALSSAQLNATVSDPINNLDLTQAGTIAYDSPVGTVLLVGDKNVMVTFTPSDTDMYNPVSATATVTVTPATLTVTADNQTRNYGADNPTFTFQYSGFVSPDSDVPTVVTTEPTCTTTATSTSPVGTYDITCSGGVAPNYTFSYVKGTLKVNKADATVVVTPYSVTYDGHAHTATITSISGVNGETGATVGTVDVSNTSHTNAGTYSADSWSFTGTANYNDIAATTISDSINKATAIVVVTPYTVTYDGHAHMASVTSITGVNGETGATVGTVDVSNTTHTNAGTYASDFWTFTGTANYCNIAATTITDTINKATAIVVVAPYTLTYDGSPHTATVTSITGVNGESGATVGTVDVSNTSHINAGTYSTDSWSFTGAANYCNIAATTITDTINKATATVVVAPYNVTYDGHAHTASVTSITGVNGETGATVGTVDVSNTTHTNAGTYSTDSWSFAGTANYYNIAATTITDCIKKANAVVVVTPYTVNYDGSAHTATVTSITGVNGETGATVGTVDVSNTTHTPAGTYATDTWSFTGTTNYNNIGATTITDTINKANATVLVTPYSVTYDGNPHMATVTSIAGVNGETGATVGAVTLNTTHTNAGTYNTDSWSFTGAANYNNIAATTITDVINQATVSVTATGSSGTFSGQPYGGVCSAITGAYPGNTLAVTLSYSSLTAPVNAGTYTVTCTTGGDPNYNVATSTAAISISQASLTVTANAVSMDFGSTPPNFDPSPTYASYATLAGGDSATALSFSIYSGSCAPCTGSPITLSDSTPAGTYTIQPSGLATTFGAGNYAITYTNGTLTVNRSKAVKGTITITPGDPSSVPYGGQATATVALTPYSIGGVPVLQQTTDNTTNPPTTTYPGFRVYLVPVGGMPSQAVLFGTGTATVMTDNQNNKTGFTVSIPAAVTVPPGQYNALVYGDDTDPSTLGSLVDKGYVGGLDTNDIAYPTLNSTGAPTGQQQLDVIQATVTVTFTAADKTYDGTNTASVSNCVIATGKVGSDDVGCTVASGTFASSNASASPQTVSATATLTGTTAGNYTLTNPVTTTAKINKANATISVTPYHVTYDANPHTATATATGVGGVDLTSDFDLSHTTHTSAGTYSSDYWTFTDPTGNYNIVSNTTITDQIDQATASITVTPYHVTYDTTAHTAAGTATGVGGVVLTSDLDLTHTNHTNAGTYSTDYWTFTDPTGNYKNVGNTTITDQIDQATASITVTPYHVTYDTTAHTAAGTATGVGGVVLTSDLDLTHTNHTNAGTYSTDYWTFTDPTGNYKNVGNTTITDLIDQATAAVVVAPYTVTYDGNPHTATVTSITGVNGESGATVGNVTLNSTHTAAGIYNTDSWTFTGAANYNNVAATTITDLIKQAPLTITATSGGMVYGGPVFPVTASYSGFVNGESASNLMPQPGCGTLATSASPVIGSPYYPSMCSGAADPNYSIGYVNGSVQVTPATTSTAVTSSVNPAAFMQLVTFTATVTPQYGGTIPTGIVTFYNNGSSIGTGTLSLTACGTPPCPVQATYSTTSLPDNTYPTALSITAVYGGDGNFVTSTSPALLQAVYPAPNVNLTPQSVSFGNTNLGSASTPMTITLSNIGDATLTPITMALSGDDPGDFVLTNGCPASLGFTATSPYPSCTITVKFQPVGTGVRDATLTITDNDDEPSGSAQTVSQTILLTGSGLSSITGTSLYTDALFATANGCGSIVASGGSTVDSFNSASGYSASHQNSGGNVGSNGNVTLSGSKSAIYGTVAVDSMTTGNCTKTSTTGVSTSGGATTGGLVALHGPINYPNPPAPNPVPPTTTQNISGSCTGITGCTNTGTKTVTLLPGQYGNLTLSGGTTAHLSQGTYNLNTLKLSGNSILHVDSGPVVINLAGASLSGGNPAMDASGGSLENATHVPANLQITYGGSHGVTLSGGASSYATVYAPNAFVNMSGGSDFFGSIIGSTITNSGGTAIHYDSNLPIIAANSYIWFTAVASNVKGLPPSGQVKLYLTSSTVSFDANGSHYTVQVPNGVVTFNSATQSSGAKTTYDLTNTRWNTAVAASGLTGNTFVTGLAFPVPSNFPTGIQNVTWSAAFSTDTPGITLQWQWGAAVYTQLGTTYATSSPNNTNVLGVNAEDGSADAYGTDPAGTPETDKQFETFGGTLGYLSAGSGVVPTIAPMSVSPSSLVFAVQNQGTTSAAMTATLTNNDMGPHNIASIQFMGTNAGEFALTTGTKSCVGMTSLAGGDSCTLYVTFTPGNVGARTAKIVLNDDANNSPQTVYLTGTGQ